jgi:hypothetical protein
MAPGRCSRLFGALLLAALPLAARAGSVTAESIWDKGNALQRAQEQVPRGATVTGSRCTEVNVRTGNYRYICTVTYTEMPPAAATPNGSSAPMP